MQKMKIIMSSALLLLFCFSTQVKSEQLHESKKNGDARKLLQMNQGNLPEDFKGPVISCKGFQGPFPYMVSVRDKKNNHICGGTLISKNAVLTAAQCVDRRVSSNAEYYPILHIGGFDLEKPFKVYSTVETFIHPGWKNSVYDGNDLAILKLNETTCISPVRYVGMTYMNEEQEFLFLGFGRVSDSSAVSSIAQGKLFKLIDSDTCNQGGLFDAIINNNQVCLSGEDNIISVCNGDNGGPLIYRPSLKEFKDILAGVASYTSSTKCTEEGAAVFIKTKKYTDWIRDIVTAKSFIAYA